MVLDAGRRDRRHRRRLLLAGVAVLLAALAVMSFSAGPTASAVSPPDGSAPSTTVDVNRPVVTQNEFIPEDANLGDCISALPPPDCGSEARGGWRQVLVFGVIAVGLALVGWRVVVAVRRRDRATT